MPVGIHLVRQNGLGGGWIAEIRSMLVWQPRAIFRFSLLPSLSLALLFHEVNPRLCYPVLAIGLIFSFITIIFLLVLFKYFVVTKWAPPK